MKRLLTILLLTCASAQAQIAITPAVAGSNSTDSVIVSFCTFDTTTYPMIVDADSIVALRFDPDGALLDSVSLGTGNLHHPRTGWYELHYRAANNNSVLGLYRIYVRIRIGGAWRGAATACYQVIGEDVGDYFAQMAVAAHASGSGAYACTLHVIETDSHSAIQGAFLRVLNSAESATAAFGTSDPEGRVIFSLDNHNYRVYSYLTGYNSNQIPATVEVTPAGANDTIWMERFQPGIAPSPAMCRVYGYVSGLDGRGIEGAVVTARIQKSPLLLEGVVISPFAVTTSTDTSGYWYLDLVPNDKLDPDDTKYDLTFHYPSGTILRKQVAVPSLSSYWFRW